MGTPDLQLPVRAAIMAAMKASSLVTQLVPKAQVYPATVPANPTFPFTRFASMIASPFRATGLDSSSFRVSLQAFSKDVLGAGGGIVTPAEDNASIIGSAIKETLDGRTLVLTNGMRARLTWIQTRTMIDGDEASAWMSTVTFSANVAG